MKTAPYSLLLAAVVCTGCVTMPKLWDDPKAAAKTPAAATQQAARPRPAVTPEQVTDTNARQMAGALLDEMDREAQGAAPSPAASTAKPENAKMKATGDTSKSK